MLNSYSEGIHAMITLQIPHWPRRAERSLLRLSLLLPTVLALLAPAVGHAQSTGVVSGRVFNTATKEYIRNAEVRVEGTNLVAYSEDAGYYRLVGVPAGEATVTVTYTGTESATAKLNIT